MGYDIYGKVLIKIPNPKYIVFYNGLDEKEDCVELKLSDSFIKPDSDKNFEWTATMLNINQGHNRELMEKCVPLGEYSDFIALVRKYQESMPFDEAVDRAVTDAQEWPCIGPYLFKHRNEVRDVLLTEFDEELHDKVTYEAGMAEGEAKGRAEGLAKGEIKSLAQLVVNGLITLDIALSQTGLSEEDFIQQAILLNIPIKR